MIRNLLATTALATLIATAAYAQQDPAATAPATPPADTAQPAAPAPPAIINPDAYLRHNLIGESVYNGTGNDAENIGDVNDIVIGQDGMVQCGDRRRRLPRHGRESVAIELAKLRWAETDRDRWLVTDASKEALEALLPFDHARYGPAPARWLLATRLRPRRPRQRPTQRHKRLRPTSRSCVTSKAAEASPLPTPRR